MAYSATEPGEKIVREVVVLEVDGPMPMQIGHMILQGYPMYQKKKRNDT